MAHIVYIDEAPAFEIDGPVVRVQLHSGGEVYHLSINRANFRTAVEEGAKLLTDVERAELGRVRLFPRH